MFMKEFLSKWVWLWRFLNCTVWYNCTDTRLHSRPLGTGQAKSSAPIFSQRSQSICMECSTQHTGLIKPIVIWPWPSWSWQCHWMATTSAVILSQSSQSIQTRTAIASFFHRALSQYRQELLLLHSFTELSVSTDKNCYCFILSQSSQSIQTRTAIALDTNWYDELQSCDIVHGCSEGSCELLAYFGMFIVQFNSDFICFVVTTRLTLECLLSSLIQTLYVL